MARRKRRDEIVLACSCSSSMASLPACKGEGDGEGISIYLFAASILYLPIFNHLLRARLAHLLCLFHSLPSIGTFSSNWQFKILSFGSVWTWPSSSILESQRASWKAFKCNARRRLGEIVQIAEMSLRDESIGQMSSTRTRWPCQRELAS